MHSSRRWLGAGALLLLLLSGCWDRREIEERSNVVAIGVDLCTTGRDCRLIVTRQIAIPGRIPLGAGEGGGTRAGDTVFVVSNPGRDLSDSARNAQNELNRQLSLAHTRVMVFSEALARRGLAKYMDYDRRVPDIRRLMWVVVTEGQAEAVIRARPKLERVPSLYMSDMLDDAVRTGRLPQIFLGVFLTAASNKGEEPVAPLLRMRAPDRPALVGLAVFRGLRMVGKLTQEEADTYMQLKGLRRGSELLDVAMPGGGRTALQVYGRAAEQTFRWDGRRVHARVKIVLEAEVSELSPGVTIDDPAVMGQIESRAAAMVVSRANALVSKLQKRWDTDILGYGERVRAFLPDVWARIDNWPAEFARARVDVEAKVQVRRPGMAMH